MYICTYYIRICICALKAHKSTNIYGFEHGVEYLHICLSNLRILQQTADHSAMSSTLLYVCITGAMNIVIILRHSYPTHVDQAVGPNALVQLHRAHLGDVCPHGAVHTGAVDAQHDGKVDRRPHRVCRGWGRRVSVWGKIRPWRSKQGWL